MEETLEFVNTNSTLQNKNKSNPNIDATVNAKDTSPIENLKAKNRQH